MIPWFVVVADLHGVSRRAGHCPKDGLPHKCGIDGQWVGCIYRCDGSTNYKPNDEAKEESSELFVVEPLLDFKMLISNRSKFLKGEMQ